MEREKRFIPAGVSEKTSDFLRTAIKHGAHKQLDPVTRNLIGVYFFTEASVADLRKKVYIASKSTIRHRMKSGLTELWEHIPPDLQQIFPQEEVIKLKDPRTPEFREKLGNMRRGHVFTAEQRKNMGDSRRGKKHNKSHKKNMSAAMKKKWKDEEYRVKVSKAVSTGVKRLWENPEYRKRWREGRNIDKKLWQYAIKEDLLPKIAASGIIKECEQQELAELISLQERLQKQDKVRFEELMDKFSIILARVA